MEIYNTMPPRVLSGQDTRPARTADGGGDERILEIDALFRKPIHIGCLDDFIARIAQATLSLIVRKHKENIRPPSASTKSTAAYTPQYTTNANSLEKFTSIHNQTLYNIQGISTKIDTENRISVCVAHATGHVSVFFNPYSQEHCLYEHVRGRLGR
jgi:hypothetical protein